MGNDVKNAGQSPEGQNPALNKEKTFGIRLRASRWNTIAAAAVLVLAGFLFGWELVLHLQAEEPEMTNAAFAGYGVGFWLLSAWVGAPGGQLGAASAVAPGGLCGSGLYQLHPDFKLHL